MCGKGQTQLHYPVAMQDQYFMRKFSQWLLQNFEEPIRGYLWNILLCHDSCKTWCDFHCLIFGLRMHIVLWGGGRPKWKPLCQRSMNSQPLFSYLLIVVKSIINCFGKLLRHFYSGNVASSPVVFLDWRWGLSDDHYFVNVLIIYFIIWIIIPTNKQTNYCLSANKQTWSKSSLSIRICITSVWSKETPIPICQPLISVSNKL